MCQPPDMSLPAASGVDAGHGSNDGWSAPGEQWVPPAADQSMNSLAAQEQAILLKFGHQQQQQQQRQRAAHLAALVSMGTPAASPASAWSHGFNHPGLTEKLQRATAAATSHGKDAASPWPHQGAHLAAAFGSPAGAPAANHAMWPGAPASASLVPHLSPGLIAQGVPLGMAHLGHMDHVSSLTHMGAPASEDDDDLDPKKFKRMMSNRASAKRSRQRRQERLDELEIVSAKLQVENATVQRRLVEANDRIRKFQHENEALQSELQALKSMVEQGGKGADGAHGTASFCHPLEKQQGTNQDSCGPHGSTSEQPSSCAAPLWGSSLGQEKRKLEEGAESRRKCPKTEPETCYASPTLTQQAPTPATTTLGSPASNMTSTSTNGDGEGSPSCGVEGDEGVDRVEEPVLVSPTSIELLDDDILSSFMEECFEAKALEAGLLQ